MYLVTIDAGSGNIETYTTVDKRQVYAYMLGMDLGNLGAMASSFQQPYFIDIRNTLDNSQNPVWQAIVRGYKDGNKTITKIELDGVDVSDLFFDGESHP